MLRAEVETPLVKASLVVAMLTSLGGAAWWIAAHERGSDSGCVVCPNHAVSMVREFRHDLEEALAEDPPVADHLRLALERVDREPEKWRGYTIEDTVLVLQSRLRAKLDALGAR